MTEANPVGRIHTHFDDSAKLTGVAAGTIGPHVARAIKLICFALLNGKKILACGNGGSAAECQHFAAELMGRFERERMPLPAVALTTDSSILTAVGNDYDYARVFAKQVQGLGASGDVLLAISTSGNSANVLLAVEAAYERDMRVVALTGKNGGKIGAALTDADSHICVPGERTARIQEVHALIVHCICDGIDATLFGEDVDA